VSALHALRAATLVLALVPAALPAGAAEPARLLEGFARTHGMIETHSACHILDLYLAIRPEQRAQGLMYIRELGEFEGMLFPSQRPAVVGMWMKNTYLPLDMFFIDAAGEIREIAAQTPPLSEQTIRSREPVSAVLELNGGFAARHGIVAGDRFALLE
jgi:uncharacterized membrane protein (UPF0127 family)